jgi:hypothetical protein
VDKENAARLARRLSSSVAYATVAPAALQSTSNVESDRHRGNPPRVNAARRVLRPGKNVSCSIAHRRVRRPGRKAEPASAARADLRQGRAAEANAAASSKGVKLSHLDAAFTVTGKVAQTGAINARRQCRQP